MSSLNPKNLMLTMNAQEWADEFIRSRRPEGITTELMQAWFAAAIMCGYDHHGYKSNDRISLLEKKLGVAEGQLRVAIHALEQANLYEGYRSIQPWEALETIRNMGGEGE